MLEKPGILFSIMEKPHKNVSSEKQNVENLEDQNTEVPKEESKLQYTVTTGGTRLNIRKEPRVDAEFTDEEIEEMFQN